MARRSYRGNSLATTVAVGITSSSTSLTLTDGSSFPAGTSPFVVTLDFGQAGEEKILATTRSGNILTGLTRGYDGTAATAHSAGATARHTLAATDLDEANAHVNATSAVHGLAGALVGTTDVQTLTNKTLTAPTVGDFTNATHVHTSATTGGALALGGTDLLKSAAFSGPLVATGAGSWGCAQSNSTGASSTLSVSPLNATTMNGASVSNGYCIVNLSNPIMSKAFWRTYAEFASVLIPYNVAAPAGNITQFGVSNAAGVINFATSTADDVWIQVDNATGAVTVGGRGNSVNLTATNIALPTLTVGTTHSFRIQWPVAGGTANCLVDNVLVGTVAGVRSLATVTTTYPGFTLYTPTGITPGPGQALIFQLAVADTNG